MILILSLAFEIGILFNSPETYFVDKAGLEFRDAPDSAGD